MDAELAAGLPAIPQEGWPMAMIARRPPLRRKPLRCRRARPRRRGGHAMIARCPVCHGSKSFTVKYRCFEVDYPCYVCHQSGRIEIIELSRAELEGKWLPIDRVADAKARQHGEAA